MMDTLAFFISNLNICDAYKYAHVPIPLISMGMYVLKEAKLSKLLAGAVKYLLVFTALIQLFLTLALKA